MTLVESTVVEQLEILHGKLDVQVPGDLRIASRCERYTPRDKARAFLRAVVAETNALFFVGLLIATCLATRLLLP